jgi:hypothetical protein
MALTPKTVNAMKKFLLKSAAMLTVLLLLALSAGQKNNGFIPAAHALECVPVTEQDVINYLQNQGFCVVSVWPKEGTLNWLADTDCLFPDPDADVEVIVTCEQGINSHIILPAG